MCVLPRNFSDRWGIYALARTLVWNNFLQQVFKCYKSQAEASSNCFHAIHDWKSLHSPAGLSDIQSPRHLLWWGHHVPRKAGIRLDGHRSQHLHFSLAAQDTQKLQELEAAGPDAESQDLIRPGQLGIFDTCGHWRTGTVCLCYGAGGFHPYYHWVSLSHCAIRPRDLRLHRAYQSQEGGKYDRPENRLRFGRKQLTVCYHKALWWSWSDMDFGGRLSVAKGHENFVKLYHSKFWTRVLFLTRKLRKHTRDKHR